MIVRTLEEIIGSERDTRAQNWNSRRLLLRSDGAGFSLHDTVIHPGTETLIWYRHHVEAVYCIEGEGEIELTETGTVYPLRPGTLYTLNGHERHWLRTPTGLRMICVFNPPLTGKEIHDADGVYPPAGA
jgi:L-ectoine synthase